MWAVLCVPQSLKILYCNIRVTLWIYDFSLKGERWGHRVKLLITACGSLFAAAALFCCSTLHCSSHLLSDCAAGPFGGARLALISMAWQMDPRFSTSTEGVGSAASCYLFKATTSVLWFVTLCSEHQFKNMCGVVLLCPLCSWLSWECSAASVKIIRSYHVLLWWRNVKQDFFN